MTGRAPGTPPRLSVWLVSAVLPPDARRVVLGDLHERYRAREARDGRRSADRWFRRQAAAFVLRVPLDRMGARPGCPLPGHDRRGGRALVGLGADLRLAARTFQKRPALAVTVTFILALAVGANTTVFSVVDAVLLRPLPFPQPERLVMLWDAYPPEAKVGDRSPITLAHFHAWERQTDLFSGIGAYESASVTIDHGDWPERVDGALVTRSLLPLLGARAELGRLFLPEDEAPGAEPVVVLGHSIWTTRFGGSRDLVGRTISLNGKATRVVGVTSADFWFYDPYSAIRSLTGRAAEAARLWQPLPADGVFQGETDYPRYRVIARLAEGRTMAAAADAARALRTQLPPTSVGLEGEVRLVPLTEQVVADARPRLVGLFGAVALVLLIACVNLVSLLLMHLDARRPEFAVRAALGAGRGRLTRQLVLETGLLSLAGGLLGLVVAKLATTWLLSLVPRGLPLAHRVQLDAGVLAFGVGLSLLSGIVIGILASWKLDARRLAGTLAAGHRTVAGARTSRRMHGALVATEVALSLVLLISATILLRGLVSLHATDTGFDARGVLTFEAFAGAGGTSSGGFLVDLEERLAALPGVAAVGGTSALPFSRWSQSAKVEVDDASGLGGATAAESQNVAHRLVSPGYFAAIALPVVAGRAFEAGDRAGAPPVAIVDQAFVARQLGGDPNPVGRSVLVTRGRSSARHTIVGVVADVRHSQLFETPRPTLYAPARQTPIPFQRFAVRATGGDPLRLVEPVRRTAAAIDPRQPLQEFIAFDALVAQSIEEETFYTQVLAAFAATALLLTVVGIFSVVSHATRQRDREVGIRMALGAGAGRVRRLVLGGGLRPVLVGLALGWLGAMAATTTLRSLLHGVAERDVPSFAVATAAFALAAAAACLIPARRASRLDPVQVLRGQ